MGLTVIASIPKDAEHDYMNDVTLPDGKRHEQYRRGGEVFIRVIDQDRERFYRLDPEPERRTVTP